MPSGRVQQAEFGEQGRQAFLVRSGSDVVGDFQHAGVAAGPHQEGLAPLFAELGLLHTA